MNQYFNKLANRYMRERCRFVYKLTCKLTYSYIGILLLLLVGCNDFGDINTDPNNPSQPDTRSLYVYAARRSVQYFYMQGIYDPWSAVYSGYIAEKTNKQYSGLTPSSFYIGDYYVYALKNLNKIIELNTNEKTSSQTYVTAFGDNNNQIAVARTLKAYIYMHLTDALGMIPYFESIQGNEENFKPKFDDQQSIYTDLNKELEEAYSQFDESKSLDSGYEIFYNGDISKWKKLNASVRMQLAIKLFKCDENTGKIRFKKAFEDGFIRSNEDIFQFKYIKDAANRNPLYLPIVISSGWDYYPSATFIETLQAYNDPRITIYATPNKYGTFCGMPTGLTPTEAARLNPDTISSFHPNYYQQDSPAKLITPSSMLFTAAEAAERGWIDASAENLYYEAISASFNQYGISSELSVYLTQPQVHYKTSGTVSERIVQIATQKWLTGFMQDGFESWSDWRRLGIPQLTTGSNSLITKIPRRRVYHTDDYNANLQNYKASVSIQGPDALDTRVWWDRE